MDDQDNGMVINSDGSVFQWETYYLRELLELRDSRFDGAEIVEYADGSLHLQAHFLHRPTARACTWRFWSRDEPTPSDKSLIGPVENAKIRYGEYIPANGEPTKSAWKWVEADGRRLSGGKRVYTPKEEEGE